MRCQVPPNTIKTNIKVGAGRAKFELDQNAIIWRITKFTGGSEFMMCADLDLMQTANTEGWSRPPISVDFNVSKFTASGVHVRFLRVNDKSGYKAARWVRYVTKAGEYQVQMASSDFDVFDVPSLPHQAPPVVAAAAAVDLAPPFPTLAAAPESVALAVDDVGGRLDLSSPVKAAAAAVATPAGNPFALEVLTCIHRYTTNQPMKFPLSISA